MAAAVDARRGARDEFPTRVHRHDAGMGMKVYIAEKPKLGRAIAKELAKRSPQTGGDNQTFVMGKDWAVCWGSGHVYELQDPDYYHLKRDPAAPVGASGKVKWTFDHLPLLPALSEWKLRPSPGAYGKGLRARIKELVGRATVLVNAGDPDREGQTLVDEIIQEMGWKKPVRRVLMSATDEIAVARGIDNERDNKEFEGLSNAGRARARSDWLVGMNFSEACTLQAQAHGFNGKVVAIGRVQTPILGLLVAREHEIRDFQPVDHFGLTATITVKGGSYKALWQPSDQQSGRDDEGRVINKAAVEDVQSRVCGQTGAIVEYKDQNKRTAPDAPFSIEQLQMLMSKKYGYSSADTLSLVQSLYESGYVSYPRSGSRLLPEDQFHEAPRVLDAIRQVVSDVVDGNQAALSSIDPKVKSKAWTDKYGAHHAIIPTQQRAPIESFDARQRNVYVEICKRYAAQFMPDYTYRSVVAIAEVAGERFKATGSTPISFGWRSLYGGSESLSKANDEVQLPQIVHGESATCQGLDIVSKRTEPPARFTDASLLWAMVNIHKFVKNPKIKIIFEKMLAANQGGDEDAVCGLGTPATRDQFIPKLVERGFVYTQKQQRGKEMEFVPSPAGMALIAALPQDIGQADMTALWESVLDKIQAGSVSIDQFLNEQGKWIAQTVDAIRSAPMALPNVEIQKKSYSGGKKSGGKSHGGGPSRFPKAAGSAPKSRASSGGGKCSKCGGRMAQRSNAKGSFLGCANYPTCRHTEQVR